MPDGLVRACGSLLGLAFCTFDRALQLHPIGVLARALDNADLNALLEEIRQRTGNTVIYRQGTIRRVMRMLHGGDGVAVLIDQHIQGRDAIYVDFFERPAATTS